MRHLIERDDPREEVCRGFTMDHSEWEKARSATSSVACNGASSWTPISDHEFFMLLCYILLLLLLTCQDFLSEEWCMR